MTTMARTMCANLLRSRNRRPAGLHFVGPYWADNNGARVNGKVSGRADAPVGKEVNVQWLKLDVIERFGSTDLRFQQATLIQRVLT
jgi:Protein of unknown function (DUF3455)